MRGVAVKVGGVPPATGSRRLPAVLTAVLSLGVTAPSAGMWRPSAESGVPAKRS
jgi:hypothetical protein